MSDGVSWYLEQIGRVPLLTPAEEILLGRRVQAMRQLLSEHPQGPYTKQQDKIIKAGTKAKQRIILANLRLVVNIASKYNRVYVSTNLQDLIQDGSKGLIRAAELFDPERGYKFSTYCYFWIRQACQRGVLSNRQIYLPYTAVDRLKALKSFLIEYQRINGKAPTVREIAEGISMRQQVTKRREDIIHELMPHLFEMRSIHKPLTTSREGADLALNIPDKRPNELDEMEAYEGDERLIGLLQHIDPKARRAVLRHFGIGTANGKPATYGELGIELGMKPRDVKTMVTNALARLRELNAGGADPV